MVKVDDYNCLFWFYEQVGLLKNTNLNLEKNFDSIQKQLLELKKTVDSMKDTTGVSPVSGKDDLILRNDSKSRKDSFSTRENGADSNSVRYDDDDATSMNSSSLLDQRLAIVASLLALSEPSALNGPDAQYNRAVDRVLNVLHPNPTQIQHRRSVTGWLQKHVRRSLSCTTFGIGLDQIGCALPDDSIKLTAVLSKNRSVNWHKLLMERLNYFAQRAADDPNYNVLLEDNDEEEDNPLDDFAPSFNHVVTEVSFSSTNSDCVVSCKIDEVPCEIAVNRCQDLCMLAFFEEIANLVGQKDLFKRSLILIRAWWTYEASSYVESSMKNCLSDATLTLMMCCLFNLHHRKISSPFQALCLFLVEFGGYNGSTQAITLQGIVPFRNSESDQPILQPVLADHLIEHDIIDKYIQAYNIGIDMDDPYSNEFLKRNDSNDDMLSPNTMEEGSTVISHQSETSQGRQLKIIRFVNNQIQSYERAGFNVVNPFDMSNMVTGKVSRRRLLRIEKAFVTGASNLSAMLTKSKEAPEAASELLRNYFPNIGARYAELWQRDESVAAG